MNYVINHKGLSLLLSLHPNTRRQRDIVREAWQAASQLKSIEICTAEQYRSVMGPLSELRMGGRWEHAMYRHISSMSVKAFAPCSLWPKG